MYSMFVEIECQLICEAEKYSSSLFWQTSQGGVVLSFKSSILELDTIVYT